MRDDAMALRADLHLFTDKVIKRAESIIPSPGTLRKVPVNIEIDKQQDAWRAITLLQHVR